MTAVSESTCIRIRPQYQRLGVDDGVELAERNFHPARLDWQLPLDECALICLDVWNWHFATDGLARFDEVTRRYIVPLVRACREHGLAVIHAPAWPVATKSANWVRLLDPFQDPPRWPDSPAWPPAEFRNKTGRYARYARPVEAHDAYCNHHRDHLRDFHDAVRPMGDEEVIVSGEELHRVCARRSILHLFYVGFATNACMIYRDYGIKDMIGRGYHGILLRDCTMGMETAQTVQHLTCTRGIIATLEQFKAYTLESGELITALRETATDTKSML